MEAKCGSDAAGLEIIKNHGVVRFLQSGLNDGSFSQINLGSKQRMDDQWSRAHDDPIPLLDLQPGIILVIPGSEFLADLPRNDDIAD